MGIKEDVLKILVKDVPVGYESELCFFRATGQLLTGKNVITTVTQKPGLGLGIGVPLTKHFGIGIGKLFGKKKTEKTVELQKSPCVFYMMEERFLVTAKGDTFRVLFDEIKDITLHADSIEMKLANDDIVVFLSKSDVSRFKAVQQIMLKAKSAGFDLDDLKRNDSSNDKVKSISNNTRKDDYAKALFLWAKGTKASEIGKNKDYPKYLFNEAGILSGSQFHKRMIDEGYLEPAGCKDYLEQCSATELKEILTERELKSSGKKDALVERILENIPEDEIMNRFTVEKYILSDKGRDFLEKNEDYVKLHTLAKDWQITFADYDKSRQKQPTAKFFDICWGILNSRLLEYSGTLGLVRNQYFYMYCLLDKEGRQKDATRMLVLVLYFDANEGFFAPRVIKDLADREEYYSSEMTEEPYKRQVMSKGKCSKKMFTEIINSIFDGTFDAEKYNKILR